MGRGWRWGGGVKKAAKIVSWTEGPISPEPVDNTSNNSQDCPWLFLQKEMCVCVGGGGCQGCVRKLKQKG